MGANITEHMEIDRQYLIKTEHGFSLLVVTKSGKWYQQIHSTLCYCIGGAEIWVELDKIEAVRLIDTTVNHFFNKG